jgi:hypothetical protein
MQFSPDVDAARRTFDGTMAGNHDQSYAFGHCPRWNARGPFTTREHAHLLVLQSRVHDALFGADDLSKRKQCTDQQRRRQGVFW